MKQYMVRCITSYKIHPDYTFEESFSVEASSAGDAVEKVKEVLPSNEIFHYANLIKEI